MNFERPAPTGARPFNLGFALALEYGITSADLNHRALGQEPLHVEPKG